MPSSAGLSKRTAIEAVNQVKPVKGLRWTFSYLDQAASQNIERMKRLDMYVQIHSSTVQGALMFKFDGDRTSWASNRSRRR